MRLVASHGLGSVSIPQHIILAGGLKTYQMWVTLFESPDDDEYDGVMGCNDYEDPRVLLTFTVEQ